MANVFRITSHQGRLFLACEKQGWLGYGPMVDADGTVRQVEGLTGKQGYSVRVDSQGNAWFAGSGLYRLADGRWKQVWPAR